MYDLKKALYSMGGSFFQNILVSMYGARLVMQRYKKPYFEWKRFYRTSSSWSLEKLKQYQSERLKELVSYAYQRSQFYHGFYKGLNVGSIERSEDLCRLPILTKEIWRENLTAIKTTRKGIHVHTGGTTGTPLEVIFTSEDFQERMARLTIFREESGAFNRHKRATFSARIVVPLNYDGKVFWRYNATLRQRLYSTFHLNEENLGLYISDLNKFKPEWIDGFPSSIYLIARFSLKHGQPLLFNPKAVFVTSENLYDYQKAAIEEAFGCSVINQYASSEGAPFVTQCKNGNLHYDLRTGVFEMENGQLLVTSFTTHGTPLIRYAIGDKMVFSEDRCDCGNHNPIVQSIDGREQDYILSPERGPVVTGLAGIFKKVPPVIRETQLVQSASNKVEIHIAVDPEYSRQKHDLILVDALKECVGPNMKVEVVIVDHIGREASGKYRFIKRTF